MTVDLGYIRASDGTGEAVRAAVTAARSVGATTLQVDSIVNLPEKFIATTGTLNTETGELDPDGITVVLGHVDGANLEIDEFAPGYPDAGNGVGQIVLIKPATAWADMIADFLEVSHNDDGTLNTDTIESLLNDGRTVEVRSTPRLSTMASTATLTPNIDNYNQYEITAQAAALDIANPTGTPINGDIIIITLKDNGTARAITYGTNYSNISGLDSLTTTVLGKWHVLGIRYSTAAGKWQILSISTEA